MRNIIMLTTLAFSSEAVAQNSVDVHGFYLSPSDGDIHDPLRTWRSEAHEQHSFGVNLLGEYAYHPLIRSVQVGDVVTRTIEVRDLAALNIGLFYSPHERVAFTLSAPAYLAVESRTESSGIGIGDLRVSAPVGLLLDQQVKDDVEFGLSVIPHLDVPGLYRDKYFHSSGLSGGGMVAATMGSEKWQASVNIGAHFAKEVAVENLTGDERLIISASGSYAIFDDLAARGEFTILPALSKNAIPWTNTPAELTGSLRGNATHQLGWVAGASTALSKGAGASTFRAFLGLDVALGAREAVLCPEYEPVTITHVVVDDYGNVVKDAIIEVDGTPVRQGEVVELEPGNHVSMITVANDDIVIIKGDTIYLLKPIYFDFDKATIRFPDSTAILAALVGTLTDHPEITKVQVATGTDIRGSNSYNMDLSKRRAESVVNWLVKQGVSSDRLTSVGYGETRLKIERCEDEACHEQNRYAEFKIIEVTE